jgi:hypothetical protein
MFALLSNKLNISDVRINDLYANVSREKDSINYNFSFLLKAFVSDSAVKVKDTTSKPMEIELDEINLSNINLSFDDKADSTLMQSKIGSLHVFFDEFNIPESKFYADEIEISKTTFRMINDKKSINTDTVSNPLPDIKSENIKLNDVHVFIGSMFTDEKMQFDVGICEIVPTSLDLAKSKIDLKKLYIENSKIEITTNKQIEKEEVVQESTPDPWFITANRIDLSEIEFKMDYLNLNPVKGTFDPNHIHLKNFYTTINSVSFKPANIYAEINSLSFKEQSGFTMQSFKSKLTFNDHKIILDELEIITPKTKIQNYLSISYSSLKDISKSIGELGVNALLNNTIINTSDITYFQPELKKQKFFSGSEKIIHLNTTIKGKVNNIKIPELLVSVGKTQLNASLSIRGLPDAKNAFYDVKIVQLKTGKNEIKMFLPNDSTLDMLPSEINLTCHFTGQIKNFNADLILKSSLGNISTKVKMQKGTENYSVSLSAEDINLSAILKDTLFGNVSLNAEINGTSFRKETAKADIDVTVQSVVINKYDYRDLKIKGNISDQQFIGAVALNDSNLAFDFNGKISMRKDQEQFAFLFDLKGADLKKLNFSNEDIRISTRAEIDMKGSSMNTFNGKAGITNLLVIKEGRPYSIDSLLFASINEEGKSSMSFSSSIISAKFDGSFAPGDLGNVITNEINMYFDIGDTIDKKLKNQNFTFEINIKNHPLLREVILPGLEEFEPIEIKGKLDSQNNIMTLDASIPRIKYSGINVDSLKFSANTDPEKINYSLTLGEASNPTIKIISTTLSGEIKDDEAGITLNMKDSSSEEKILLNAKFTSLREGDYHLTILPEGLRLNGTVWNVPEDNFIRFGKNGLLFNHFQLTNNEQFLAIHTPAQKIDEEITIEFKKFQLFTFSQLVEKDSSLVSGELTGTFQTKKVNNVSAFIADLKINSFAFHEIPVGDIKLHAENKSPTEYSAKLNLSGNDNNVDVDASYNTSSPPELDASVNINSLTLKTISAFSNNQISNPKGKITGNIKVKGPTTSPQIDGKINFEDAGFHSLFANNYFNLKNEKISFDSKGIYFTQFTIADSLDHKAVLNGKIEIENLKITKFDLNAKLNEFVALNTTEENNKLFFGKLILTSNTTISGNISLPKIYSKTKLMEGSYLTVAIPESKVTTDRGEGVVVFTDPKNKISPILTRETNVAETQSEIKGIDLSADLEVDRNSTLKILVDPVSGDSLVLKGDATLSFGIDPSGKTSLTGTFTIADGSYRVSLQDLIRKDFKIKSGSTIAWNGGPMDAEINIDAVHEQKTSPIDLVAGQIGGLSEQEKNTYKQALPFQVVLHMTGPLLKPIISFEIDLPPKYRGAMGGTVYAKLTQLNSDPSELNKQVFALLVLGRFIQEDPLASSGPGGGINSVARTSVSKFLSQQLNRFSNKYLKGVELNFDLQSYDDYTTGTAEARTQLAVGLKKQLFNERVSVEVGSMVDLSNNTGQGNTNELASDVTVEYKLGPGTYRLKAFRQNQYEDVIEGPLNVTGLGLIYTKDFDYWKDLFKRSDPEEDFIAPLKND